MVFMCVYRWIVLCPFTAVSFVEHQHTATIVNNIEQVLDIFKLLYGTLIWKSRSEHSVANVYQYITQFPPWKNRMVLRSYVQLYIQLIYNIYPTA